MILYIKLDLQSTVDLLQGINNEDQKVATAVQLIIPEIEKFVNAAYENMKKGVDYFISVRGRVVD